MKSIQKTAKALDTVFKIFKIVAMIGIVTAIIAAAAIGVVQIADLDLESVGFVDQVLDLGDVQLTLSQESQIPLKSLMGVSLADLAMFLVMAVLTVIAIGYIRQILHPMVEGEPFREIVPVNLKKLAWLSVIYGVVGFFLDGLETFLVSHFYGDTFEKIFAGSGVAHISYEKDSDLTFLLVAGVLFLLSYVFRYTQELQKLADETL